MTNGESAPARSENGPGGRDDRSVAVIVLTYNQRDLTLRMLDTLYGSSSVVVDVLLWDNASSDGTASAVGEAFPDVLVHHHESNLGVASGRNAAARLAIETWAT